MDEVPAEPAPLALTEVAGTWDMRVMPEQGDSTLMTFTMIATADPSGWKFNFPKRPPVPASATASGASLVLEAGPYESVFRRDVKVTTYTVARLQGGKLVGATAARYATSKPDSVVQLRLEGTRVP